MADATVKVTFDAEDVRRFVEEQIRPDLERLHLENAQLRAERDALVGALRSMLREGSSWPERQFAEALLGRIDNPREDQP